LHKVKKLLVFILIVIVAPLLAALYGTLHDQLTYTISPEYYTKFKFFQFELTENKEEAILSNPRLAVAAVGVMATFWMGIPIGIILGAGWLNPSQVERNAYRYAASFCFDHCGCFSDWLDWARLWLL
jgi:hypothetical protein